MVINVFPSRQIGSIRRKGTVRGMRSCHIAGRGHGISTGGFERRTTAGGAGDERHRRCPRGPVALTRPLPLGHAAGTHLRVGAARLSPVRRRDADHRVRNRWRLSTPHTGPHRRTHRSAENRPGTWASGLGRGNRATPVTRSGCPARA